MIHDLVEHYAEPEIFWTLPGEEIQVVLSFLADHAAYDALASLLISGTNQEHTLAREWIARDGKELAQLAMSQVLGHAEVRDAFHRALRYAHLCDEAAVTRDPYFRRSSTAATTSLGGALPSTSPDQSTPLEMYENLAALWSLPESEVSTILDLLAFELAPGCTARIPILVYGVATNKEAARIPALWGGRKAAIFAMIELRKCGHGHRRFLEALRRVPLPPKDPTKYYGRLLESEVD